MDLPNPEAPTITYLKYYNSINVNIYKTKFMKFGIKKNLNKSLSSFFKFKLCP